MTAPKTILFITSCPLAWGGSEELWAGAAIELRQRGHRVITGRMEGWVPRPLHRKWQQLRDAGVGVNDFGVPVLYSSIPEILRRQCRPLSGFFYHLRNLLLSHKIRRLKPDLVVISQGGTFDGMDRVELPHLACLAGVPFVLICQKASEMDWPHDEIRQRTRNHFLNAKGIYFVSKHNRQVTEHQLGINLPRSEVVRNPFMIKTTEPLPWPETRDGVFKFACVGRMWPREKGQDILINVLAREKWRNRPIEVNFYGEGPMEEGIAEMAKFFSLKNVHCRGFSGDVTNVWRDHHALIMPSRAEGLALAQVEAMICGRVAIMAAAGGAGEIIEEGVTGFLADSTSEDALDEAMERAWNKREVWPEIGLRAAESIWQSFPRDPCASFADEVERLCSLPSLK